MPSFAIAGTVAHLTVASVTAALKGVASEPVRKHAVKVNGQLFPVVQALKVASGVPRARTRSARARAIFAALGMRLVDLGASGAGTASPGRVTRRKSLTAAGPVVGTPSGRAWKRMGSRPAYSVAGLDTSLLPPDPGVYAFYRAGRPVYVGRAIAAGGLKRRLSTQHLRTDNDLSWSAFRRNVAELLGVAPTAVTRLRPPHLTEAQIAPVVAWVQECELRWIACTSREVAAALEEQIKAEWMPPLTKR